MSVESAPTSRPRLARRALLVGRTAARETSDRAAALAARGRDVLHLYGAPFWLPPPHVLQAAAEWVSDPDVAHSQGLPSLRQAIAAKLERDNGFHADPEREILVTHAGMHALSIAFAALLDPGDEVLLHTPAFYFYGAIQLAGGVPVYAPTRQQDGWRWDAEALAEAITPRTKLIVINSPTNPTGYVASRDDLLAVAELARRHDLLVLSDEAYDNMAYGARPHVSFASLPGTRGRAITVYSLTKTYALKQWRIGFMVAPADLLPAFRKLLEWNVLSCNHVAQHAARAALEGPQQWVREIAPRFRHCRDLMVEGLQPAPGISFSLPDGGPFLFLDVSGLGVTGAEFSRRLLEEYGVPSEAGDVFGSAAHVRLQFGGEDETIREAARRIVAAAERLAP